MELKLEDNITELNYNYKNNINIINEETILNTAKQYKGIRSCEIKGNACYIVSYGNEEWYFKLDGIHNKNIILYHKNSNDNKKYHIQRKFRDVNFLMRSISSHDLYKFRNRKPKIVQLFEKIEQENRKVKKYYT